MTTRRTADERQGQTIQEFAQRWRSSETTVWRLISNGLLRAVPIGRKLIIPAEEDARVSVEGLPIAPEYKRMTTGPVNAGVEASLAERERKRKAKAKRKPTQGRKSKGADREARP